MKALATMGCLLALAAAPGAIDPDKPWARHTILTGLRGADGARFADADGDGDLDLVTGWEEAGVVTICLNPGPKAARQPWPTIRFTAVTPGVEDAVLVDLDGDGAVDVVSCCEGTGKAVVVHWAPKDAADYRDTAKWTIAKVPATLGRMWMFALPMQVDGKHGIDLVVGSKNAGGCVAWLESPSNPRDLAAWKLHPMTDAGWIMSLLARDMDGDGDLDVMISDRKKERRAVRWLENPGPGPAQTRSWASHVVGAAGREPMFLDVGDLDGDGLEDVVVNLSDAGPMVLRRLDPSGKRWSEHLLSRPENAGTGKAVSLGDVDGDGRLDLVLSCENARKRSGVVWLSRGQNPLTGPWRRNEIAGPIGVKYDLCPLIDLDGDGDLDVVTTEEVTGLGIVWYENPRR